MGWLRYLLLGDLGQQLDLQDHADEIERLKESIASRPAISGSIDSRIDVLQRENDELKLYLAAIVRLLINKNVVTAAEIRSLASVIDRQDGDEDGKFEGPILPLI